MTGQLADVEARIRSVDKLSTVISAMRGIAAARAQEAQAHVDSIRLFAATIGDAIGQALALLPEDGARPATREGSRRRNVILLTAEQGFAGGFSERIFDAAAPYLRDPCDLFVAGDRGLPIARERDIGVDWSAAMIAHPAQVAGLATRLTEAIYEALNRSAAAEVVVVHAMPGGPNGTEVISKQLVPFDYSRFSALAQGPAPLINLPPERLLARLVEEYVFAELSEAVMLSYAAENDARMRAMIAAHDNVSATLDGLVISSRRLRQQEITEEIIELASSSLATR